MKSGEILRGSAKCLGARAIRASGRQATATRRDTDDQPRCLWRQMAIPHTDNVSLRLTQLDPLAGMPGQDAGESWRPSWRRLGAAGLASRRPWCRWNAPQRRMVSGGVLRNSREGPHVGSILMAVEDRRPVCGGCRASCSGAQRTQKAWRLGPPACSRGGPCRRSDQ